MTFKKNRVIYRMRILPHNADKFEDARLTLCKIALRKRENKSHHHFDTENYHKAERWAAAQVGKTFDEVYSIWRKLPWLSHKFRNKEWFERIIQTDVVLYNGELWETKTYDGWTRVNGTYECLYADPSDGRIKYKPRNKTKPKVKPLDCIILTDYTQLYKDNGIWYHITIPETITEPKYSWETKPAKVHIIPPRMKFEDFKKKYLWIWGIRPKFIKRSASKDMLKKHGIKNDPWKQKQTF